MSPRTGSKRRSTPPAAAREAGSVASRGAPPLRVTVDDLLARHAVLFLDAYGVLLHHAGALPGAVAFIDRLDREHHPYFVLTNDASRLPSSAAARWQGMGLPIPEERIITSASLLGPCFARLGLAGARCAVLGPEDSRTYVTAAGGEVVAADDDPEVVVVCDEVGYPFVETVDAVLTSIVHRVAADRPVHLLLPNPDLVYPKGETALGITAGSIAAVLEAALGRRFPGRDDLRFRALGKPHRPIFDEAIRRAGTTDAVMIGDQLGTDIQGALEVGLAAALCESGLDRFDPRASAAWPTYLLRSV